MKNTQNTTIPHSALKRRVKSLIRKLNDFYPDFKPKKRRDPLDELILTILSQNTNDNNSFEGFKRLRKKFPTWDDVASADSSDIADAISVSGLGATKTKYIQQVLRQIGAENTANKRFKKKSPYHLEHLKKMNLDDTLKYLVAFKGVGLKTASCVAAFSLNLPAFPVDTHIHRILKRQGIVPERMGAEDAHHVMYRITDPYDRYRFHVNLINYGREICHARNPECDKCVIKRGCLYL